MISTIQSTATNMEEPDRRVPKLPPIDVELNNSFSIWNKERIINMETISNGEINHNRTLRKIHRGR